MKCKNCGTNFEEGIFCPECGTRIDNDEKITENLNEKKLNTKSSTKKKKGKQVRKESIIVLVAVIVAFIAIAIAVSTLSNSKKEADNSSNVASKEYKLEELIGKTEEDVKEYGIEEINDILEYGMFDGNVQVSFDNGYLDCIFVRSEASNDISLYGVSIGMNTDEAVNVIKNTFPDEAELDEVGKRAFINVGTQECMAISLENDTVDGIFFLRLPDDIINTYVETGRLEDEFDPAETEISSYDDSSYDDSPYDIAKMYELNAESEIMEYDGHAYAIFNFMTLGLGSFDACEEYCEEMGGHLAVINSQEENEAVYKLVTDSGLKLAFFGYTDQEIEGEWEWVDGSDNSYTNWCKISGKEQPNNGAANGGKDPENYAEFYKETANGMWNDAIFGANTYRFVCEWE